MVHYCRIVLICAVLLPGAVHGQVANLRFHSDVLLNLHHILYAAAWARRPESGTRRALAGRLPAPLDAPLSQEEQKIWNDAVDYYDRRIADRDLLFGNGMEALKAALVAGDRKSGSVGNELAAI